jgi:hypothetical protein
MVWYVAARRRKLIFNRRGWTAAEIVSESAKCVKRAGAAAFDGALAPFHEIVKANVARKCACSR